LIEVKFRGGTSGPAEEVALKEAIVVKNLDTQKVLETRFIPYPESDRLDREIQNKQLANLLQFYLDRCKRHGLITAQLPEDSDIQGVIQAVMEGSFEVEFEKAGYIFNLQGESKDPENYKENRIHVIGKPTIYELLDIPSDVESLPITDIQLPEQGPTSVQTGEDTILIGGEIVPPLDAGTEALEVIPVEIAEEKEAEVPQPKGETPLEAVYGSEPSKVALRIHLGQNCDTKKEVFWDPFTTTPKKLANPHVLIVGKTGAGKTQSAAAFVAGLWDAKVPSVIFDFQGEYMDSKLTNANHATFLECTAADVLDAADGIDVNPLEVPDDPHTGKKQNFMKVVYQVATSLGKIFGLGDIQRAILRDAIGQAFVVNGFVAGNKATWASEPPMLSQVWEILKILEKSEGGNVRNLNLRIQPLFETGIFIESEGAESFERIFSRTSIIRLSNLATPELMVAVSRFVLQKIYANMLSKGPCDQMRVFAVIDEAHKLSYDETLTELIREARKYGVGILLASQSVKDFDRIVFDMVGTKIALQLEGDDAKVMADNLGLTEKNDRDMARSLILHQPPHRALVRSNHFEPYIQADLTPFWKKRSGGD